ncbi:hypothetical protein ACFV1W_20630 [Kitasatospora sp. NPDC059648]|uniref:hypothetical protein n=1 Tax=Kitasatospora sp. NPDC059648 TaxID=3346894 RepID=UPI0036BC5D24
MINRRGALTALHLFLVWATTVAVVPALGFNLVLTAWARGVGATVPVLALGGLLMVGLLTVAGLPARTVVPLCGSVPKRLLWAVLVLVLGTLGLLAGLAAYDAGVDLGNAGTRIALTGAPYAVAAAFFVSSRWVRLGSLAVLAAAVAYGGFIGPSRAEHRRDEAAVARYREHPELLYLGTAPAGMQASRVRVGPASFTVDYRPVREGYESGYAGLVVRPSHTPALRCPEPPDQGTTCTVDAHGGMVTVHASTQEVTLTRRYRDAEVSVISQTIGEAGLRDLLNTLHPLSDAELDKLMQEKRIDYSF